MKSKDLLSRIAGQGEFPLLKETWRSLVNQDFDIPALEAKLAEIAKKTIGVSTIESYKPSPLAADLMWLLNNEYLYADDSLPGIETSVPLLDNRLVPDIPTQVIQEYSKKIRCLLPGYLPETELEWSLYLQERRILSPSEIQELQQIYSDNENQVLEEILANHGKKGLPGALFSESGIEYASDLEEGTAWWFHASVLHSLSTDDLDLSDGFLEWSRWQGWISQSELRIWGLVDFPRDFILDAKEPSELPRAMNPEVFDSLLHYWKRFRRNQLPPLNLGQVRWLTAGLTGLKAFTTEGRPQLGAEDKTVDRSNQTHLPQQALAQLFEQFSGFSMSPAALFHGVLPSRIPTSVDWLPGREFSRLGFVWQGRGADSFTLYPSTQAALYSTSQQEAQDQISEVEAKLLSFLGQTPGARFSFQSLVDHSGVDTDSCHQALWQGMSKGLYLCDSLEALEQGFIQGWFSGKPKAKPPLVQSRSQQGFARPTRSNWADWNSKYHTPGNWFVTQSDNKGDWTRTSSLSDLDMSAREDRASLLLYQLFDRYPVLNRHILSQEGHPFFWSELLPYLRRLELAGELVGGQFCPELGGLQFIRRETLEQVLETSGSQSSPNEPPVWYWIHVQDLVSYVSQMADIPRRSGDHWLLCQEVAATPIPELKVLVFIKSAGKELVIMDPTVDLEILASVVWAFFRKVYFSLGGVKTRVHIQSINGEPAVRHGLGQLLKDLGFQSDPKGLMVWKY